MNTRIWIGLFAFTAVLGPQVAKADDLGAFLQGLGQAVGGQGQQGGWHGQHRTQNNWVTTQPRYRDVYSPRHVRVQDGYEHQVNPGAIVADVLGAVGEGLRNSEGSLESYPEERRPRTRYVEAHPYPSPTPRPKLTSNPVPRERAKQSKRNADAGKRLPQMADVTTFSLAGDVVEQKAVESLGELRGELGAAATDPQVQAKMDELEGKIRKGEKIDQADVSDLKNLVTASGKLAPSVNVGQLDKLADDLVGLSEANFVLSQPSTDPNGGLPQGNMDVVLIPSLPDDEIMMLPCGCAMMGTGGEGSIDVVSLPAEDVLDVPLGTGDPAPEREFDVTKRPRDGAYLMNAQDSGSTIHYLLTSDNSAGNSYSMQPGYSQHLPMGRKWIIQFDRGAGTAEARYGLTEGTYIFESADEGWELRRHKFSVTIDNSDNESSFFYNVDNESIEVAAGEVQEHQSAYPILVSFDRGDGTEAHKKLLDKKGEYRVAVDPETRGWDLFAADNLESAEAGTANPIAATKRQIKLHSQLKALLKQ